VRESREKSERQKLWDRNLIAKIWLQRHGGVPLMRLKRYEEDIWREEKIL